MDDDSGESTVDDEVAGVGRDESVSWEVDSHGSKTQGTMHYMVVPHPHGKGHLRGWKFGGPL